MDLDTVLRSFPTIPPTVLAADLDGRLASDDVSDHGSLRTVAQVVAMNLVEDVHTELGAMLPGLLGASQVSIPMASLKTRSMNTIRRLNGQVWGDLLGHTIGDLLQLPHVGSTTVVDITRHAVEEHLRHLGTSDAAEIELAQVFLRWVEAARDRHHAETVHQALLRDLALGERPGDLDALLTATVQPTPAEDGQRGATELVSCVSFEHLQMTRGLLSSESAEVTTEIALAFGVADEQFERIADATMGHIRQELARPEFADVRTRLREFGQDIGLISNPGAWRSSASRLLHDVDARDVDLEILLDLAGPYRIRDGWLIHERWNARDADDVISELMNDLTIELDDAVHALGELGVDADTTEHLLDHHPDLRRTGAVWIRWSGTMADRLEALLEHRGEPSDPEVLTDAGMLSSVRATLSADDRFVRVAPSVWGLRSWGLHEYGGVAHEMVRVLEEHGGSLALTEVIGSLAGSAAEGTIRGYASAPRFILENGVLALRGEDQPMLISGRLDRTRAALTADLWKHVVLAVPVDDEQLTNVGGSLPASVGAALGVMPGMERVFVTDYGQRVRMSWGDVTTRLPSISSLRKVARSLESEAGDLLILRFQKQSDHVDAALICGGSSPGIFDVASSLGLDPSTIIVDLAEALDVPGDRVVDALRQRGDDRLAAIVDGASWM